MDACQLPGAPSCGAHGQCLTSEGTAACACTDGFTGPACDLCAAGLLEEGARCVTFVFRYLSTNDDLDSSAALEQVLRVPTPAAGKGSRLEYYLRGELTGDSYQIWLTMDDALRYTGFVLQEPITASAAWEAHHTTCLPAIAAGRLAHLRVAFTRDSTDSSDPLALYLDDVRIVEADDCP